MRHEWVVGQHRFVGGDRELIARARGEAGVPDLSIAKTGVASDVRSPSAQRNALVQAPLFDTNVSRRRRRGGLMVSVDQAPGAPAERVRCDPRQVRRADRRRALDVLRRQAGCGPLERG
jgi:hypothetical protein